jgi:L-asparagine transporter-like permease
MTELLRTLRLRDLSLLIVGAVIGSGIFLVPAQVLRQVHGSTGLATLVWLGGGVLALLGALRPGYHEANSASEMAQSPPARSTAPITRTL